MDSRRGPFFASAVLFIAWVLALTAMAVTSARKPPVRNAAPAAAN